jgi:hypothetical protein
MTKMEEIQRKRHLQGNLTTQEKILSHKFDRNSPWNHGHKKFYELIETLKELDKHFYHYADIVEILQSTHKLYLDEIAKEGITYRSHDG